MDERHPITCADCGADMGTPEERASNGGPVIICLHYGKPDETHLCGVCQRRRFGIDEKAVARRATAVQKRTPKPAPVVRGQLSLWEE